MRGLLPVIASLALLSFLTVTPVIGDTNANCSYTDSLGTWTFQFSAGTLDWGSNCTTVPTSGETYTIKLDYPNVALDENGVTGNWTLIYNQGIEIWIQQRILFFFFGYNDTSSFCTESEVGWSHTQTQTQENGGEWYCMSVSQKTNGEGEDIVERIGVLNRTPDVTTESPSKIQLADDTLTAGTIASAAPTRRAPHRHSAYKVDPSFLKAVNEAQDWFHVKDYPDASKFTFAQWQRRRGGSSSSKIDLRSSLPEHAREIKSPKKNVSDIPISFDWRSYGPNKLNYVSPVRDQGQCGSCYSFGSAGMMEARIRIASNNAKQPILSTQDMVSCSFYSQGCEGGFPYLVAGKYGRDIGLLEEACYPYVGVDEVCAPNPQAGCNSQRWMTNEYYYIGGYYGESTVQLMQEELMANGPIAVSFMVYDDFMHYAGGVYTHQFTKDLKLSFDPFELTNHVVLIVGWGVDEATNTPYWIVKNSWGPDWGEDGFFRILRGSSEAGGECAIESITVSAIPILH